MKIAIVGLGLIGGSLARAFSHGGEHTVIGLDKNHKTLQAALEQKAIQAAAETLPPADIYFLAMAPSITVRFLKEHITLFQKGAIVTDVCGIKTTVVQECEPLCRQYGLRFVGGHPMAGREVSGFEHAVDDLFVGRSYILTKTSYTDAEALDTVRSLVRKIGITQITETTPEHHDRMIAFTSQVPHILAGAYMKSDTSLAHNGYSAGSYHDVSRVSSVDENLWSELFVANRVPLAEELRVLIGNLQQYLSAVEAGDRNKLFDLVRESRLRKEKDRAQNGEELPHKFG